MIVLLRTLTVKSKIGFGMYTECTVREMIKSGKQTSLISMYYNLSNISFDDEVLSQLYITEKIAKPGKNDYLAPIACNNFKKIAKEKRTLTTMTMSVDKALRMAKDKELFFSRNNKTKYSPHSLSWKNQGHKSYT